MLKKIGKLILIGFFALGAHPDIGGTGVGKAHALSLSPPVCGDLIRNVAQSYGGPNQMTETMVDNICGGAHWSDGPAVCMQQLMSGQVNWGGGNQWKWENAALLCAGAENGNQRVQCFQGQLASGAGFQNAVFACKSPDIPDYQKTVFWSFCMIDKQSSLGMAPQDAITQCRAEAQGNATPTVPVAVQPQQPVVAQPKAGELGPFTFSSTISGIQLSNNNAADVLGNQWMIEPVGDQRPPEFVRLRSASGEGQYLHAEYDQLQVSGIEPGWWSAMWRMEKVGENFSFRNRWKEGLLLSDPQSGQQTLWTMAAPPGVTNQSRPQTASVAPRVAQPAAPNLTVQNFTQAPLDIYVQVAPGDMRFIETLGTNQEIAVPAPVGSTWRLAQNDQWVSAFVATNQPEQILPFGR